MLHVLALGVALAGPVPAAIERSVQERMGDVRVEIVEMTSVDADVPASLVAVPEHGSRLGRRMRFILFADGARVGSVIATVKATGAAVRAGRALARGETLEAESLEAADVALEHVPLERLPGLGELAGAVTRRDIRSGEILTDALVAVPPLVRSGDEVRVSLSTGVIEVISVGRASGSGRAGDLIRVLLPSSRRGLTARITGPGSVEIVR